MGRFEDSLSEGYANPSKPPPLPEPRSCQTCANRLWKDPSTYCRAPQFGGSIEPLFYARLKCGENLSWHTSSSLQEKPNAGLISTENPT